MRAWQKTKSKRPIYIYCPVLCYYLHRSLLHEVKKKNVVSSPAGVIPQRDFLSSHTIRPLSWAETRMPSELSSMRALARGRLASKKTKSRKSRAVKLVKRVFRFSTSRLRSLRSSGIVMWRRHANPRRRGRGGRARRSASRWHTPISLLHSPPFLSLFSPRFQQDPETWFALHDDVDYNDRSQEVNDELTKRWREIQTRKRENEKKRTKE